MKSAVTEISEASIDEVKFHIQLFKVTEISKEWKFRQKRIFYFLLYSLETFQTNIKISWKNLEYFVSGTFVQNDYSRSYSCLKLT